MHIYLHVKHATSQFTNLSYTDILPNTFFHLPHHSSFAFSTFIYYLLDKRCLLIQHIVIRYLVYSK